MDNTAIFNNARLGGPIPGNNMYDFYKQQFDAFAGSPGIQKQILAEYFETQNPEAQRKKKQQEDFMNALMGGGSDMSLGGDTLGGNYLGAPVQEDVLGASTAIPQPSGNIADIMIDTNVQDNSFGANLGKITRPFEQVAAGLGDIFGGSTGNTARDEWRARNPIEFLGTNLMSGLGNKEATEFIDKMSRAGTAVQADKLAGSSIAPRDTTLSGEEAVRFMQDPNKGFRVLNNAGFEDLADRQTGSYGLLDDIGGALLSPVSNLFETGAETASFLGRGGKMDLMNPEVMQQSAAGMGYTPQNMSADKFEDFQGDQAGMLAKTGIGYGSGFIPGGGGSLGQVLGRGALSGAMLGYGQSELGDELGDTLTGAAGGAAGAGLFYGAGKLGTKVANKLGFDPAGGKIINQVDDTIKKQAETFRAQGLDDATIGMKTGLSSGANNARLNIITQTLKGPKQAKALQALANKAAQEGDDKVVGVLGSLYKVKPSISIKAPKVEGAADDTLTKTDKLINLLQSPSTIKTSKEGIAELEGNLGQKLGKNMQFDALGIQGSTDDLNFFKDEKKTRAVLDQVLDTIGAPKNAEGMQMATDTLVDARNKLIAGSGWEGTTVDDIANKTFAELKHLAPTTKLTKDEVVDMVATRLKTLTEGNVDFSELPAAVNLGDKGAAIDAAAKGLQTTMKPTDIVKPNKLQDVASGALDARNKLFASGAQASEDTQVLGALDQAIRKTLNKEITGYQSANDLYRRLYDTLKNRAATYNTSGKVSQLGKADILNMIGKKGLGLTGEAIEGVSSGKIPGSLKAGASKVSDVVGSKLQPIAGKAIDVLNMPGTKAAQKLIAPRMGAEIADQVMNPKAVSAETLGIQAPSNTGADTFTGAETLGTPGGKSPILGNKNRNDLIMMGLLNGLIEPQVANMLLESSQGPKLTAGQQDKLDKIETQRESLDLLEQMISENRDEFGQANIGGKVRDKLGGIFADPKRESIKTQIRFEVSNLLNTLSGASASDAERADIKSMLPDLEKDEPDVALGKLKKVRDRIELSYKNMIK